MSETPKYNGEGDVKTYISNAKPSPYRLYKALLHNFKKPVMAEENLHRLQQGENESVRTFVWRIKDYVAEIMQKSTKRKKSEKTSFKFFKTGCKESVRNKLNELGIRSFSKLTKRVGELDMLAKGNERHQQQRRHLAPSSRWSRRCWLA